jgi:tetratricopeptide (TPR) repeat protein
VELTFKPSVDQYLAIFDNYQNGDRTGALNRLAELPRQAVYRAVEYLRDREDDELLMAALMHTDAAMVQGGDASLHVSRAASCLKRIDADSRRKELDRKWSLAMAYYFQSDHQFLVSVPFLLELTKKYPEDLEIRLAYGSVCEATGLLHDQFHDHLQIAEEQYRWILASDQDHIEARLRLGHVLKLLGQHDEALDLLQNVLSLSADPVQLLVANLLLGEIHRIEGRLQAAIDFYESALQIDGDCLVATVGLSHALHQARRLEESTDVLKRLLQREDRKEQDSWWLYLTGHSDRFEPLLLELRREASP